MTTRATWPVAGLLAAVLAGCLADEKKLTTVPAGSFGAPVRTQSASMKEAPKATQEVSLRVSQLGQKLVAANPAIKEKVVFLTLGVPQPEVFHQAQKDGSVVYITEGLVKECKTDGELAALLSQELGKMRAEGLAKAGALRDRQAPPPMMSPRVGNDIGGAFGPADGSERMILARFEKDRQEERPSLPAPPPPETLARGFLQRAGYDAANLDAVAPLLRKAAKQNDLELLMTGKP